MVWARMLRDRLMHETRDDEQVKVKVGLLPALNEQQGDLKKQVQRFRDQLDRWIRAEQELANYALHMGSLHGGMPAVRVEPNARARLRLPDPHPPGKRIWSWEEFTYHQDRDAATVATELLGRVERFMDGLLDSFEQHVPERFGPRR
jgi:hypothetical protein